MAYIHLRWRTSSLPSKVGTKNIWSILFFIKPLYFCFLIFLCRYFISVTYTLHLARYLMQVVGIACRNNFLLGHYLLLYVQQIEGMSISSLYPPLDKKERCGFLSVSSYNTRIYTRSFIYFIFYILYFCKHYWIRILGMIKKIGIQVKLGHGVGQFTLTWEQAPCMSIREI